MQTAGVRVEQGTPAQALYSLGLILIVVWLFIPVHAEERTAVGLSSRYVTEGRDNVGHSGIANASYTFSSTGLSGHVWVAQGLREDFAEAELSLAYQTGLTTNLDLAIGATGIYTDTAVREDTDIEVFAALKSSGASFSALLESYYSNTTSGIYTNLRATYAGDHLAPFVELGFNGDYVPKESNGLNNIVVGVSGRLALGRQAFVVTLSHTTPVDPTPGDSLDHITWIEFAYDIKW